MTKIAVIQHPPVLLDRKSTVEKAVSLTVDAAAQGAHVVVFPEAFPPSRHTISPERISMSTSLRTCTGPYSPSPQNVDPLRS